MPNDVVILHGRHYAARNDRTFPVTSPEKLHPAADDKYVGYFMQRQIQQFADQSSHLPVFSRSY
jgi:hypothetical protein